MSDSAHDVSFFPLGDVRRIVSEVREMLSLRRQLAEAEISSEVSMAKRSAVYAGIGGLFFLTGLPMLAVLFGSWLDKQWLAELSFPWASLVLALVLCGGGAGLAFATWRSFRRNFNGLQASIAELKEDLVWLRELADGEPDTADSDDRDPSASRMTPSA